MNVFQAWQSGKTVRKHTMVSLHRENTAEHTWGALLLLFRYAPQASKRLIMALHLHDAGEWATADIPAHICWQMPDLKQAVQAKEDEHVRSLLSPAGQLLLDEPLTANEGLMLEVLDRAEFVLSCLHEYNLGNRMVSVPLRRGLDKVQSTMADMARQEDGLQESATALWLDLLHVAGDGVLNNEQR